MSQLCIKIFFDVFKICIPKKNTLKMGIKKIEQPQINCAISKLYICRTCYLYGIIVVITTIMIIIKCITTIIIHRYS